jgi:acetyl-CoA C-acetyltransferase
LRAVFAGKDGKGTVTAANASKLNDGASMLLMMNEFGLRESKMEPGFEIVSYADAEVEPSDFNIAPNVAIKKAL